MSSYETAVVVLLAIIAVCAGVTAYGAFVIVFGLDGVLERLTSRIEKAISNLKSHRDAY